MRVLYGTIQKSDHLPMEKITMTSRNDNTEVSEKFRDLLNILGKMTDEELLEAEPQIQLHIAMRFHDTR
jgi:hypothetical protein